jgi:hypothetical protein
MNKTLLSILMVVLTPFLNAQQVINLKAYSFNQPAKMSQLKFTSDTTFLMIVSDSSDGSSFPLMGNTVIDHRTLNDSILWRFEIKGQILISDIFFNPLGETIFTGAFQDTMRIADTVFTTPDPFDAGSLFGKLNPQGVLEWITVEDTFADNYPVSFTPVPQGYILCGGINDLTDGTLSYYNNLGEKQWQKTLNRVRTTSSIKYNAFDQSIYLTGDCEPYAVFDTTNIGDPISGVGYLSYIAKFDLNGNIQWVRTSPFVTFDFENKVALNGDNVFLFEGIDTTAQNLNLSYRLSSISSNNIVLNSLLLPSESFNLPAVCFDKQNAGLVFKDFIKTTAIVYDSVLQIKYKSEFTNNSVFFDAYTCALKNDMMLIGGIFYDTSFTLGNKTVYAPVSASNNSNLYIALIKHDALTTGINEINQSISGLKVYPNPASDKVYFSSSNNQLIATLMDLSGKKIFTSITETAMDVSGVNEGLYILDLFETTTNSHTYHKLIISR